MFRSYPPGAVVLVARDLHGVAQLFAHHQTRVPRTEVYLHDGRVFHAAPTLDSDTGAADPTHSSRADSSPSPRRRKVRSEIRPDALPVADLARTKVSLPTRLAASTRSAPFSRAFTLTSEAAVRQRRASSASRSRSIQVVRESPGWSRRPGCWPARAPALGRMQQHPAIGCPGGRVHAAEQAHRAA